MITTMTMNYTQISNQLNDLDVYENNKVNRQWDFCNVIYDKNQQKMRKIRIKNKLTKQEPKKMKNQCRSKPGCDTPQEQQQQHQQALYRNMYNYLVGKRTAIETDREYRRSVEKRKRRSEFKVLTIADLLH